MKRIYAIAVLSLLLFTPKSSFATGYVFKVGSPYHDKQNICADKQSTYEVDQCLAQHIPDVQNELKNTISMITKSIFLDDVNYDLDNFKVINESWHKNMDNFCYDYIKKYYYPGTIYRSQSLYCERVMTRQRSALLRTLFLNEGDHLDFLISSSGLCAESDTEHECLINNVDHARKIFNFTMSNLLRDESKYEDDYKESFLSLDTWKNIIILNKNIHETWLSNMNTLCHEYLKNMNNDNKLYYIKALQCEFISYEGRSRLLYNIFYPQLHFLDFPEKPQNH